LLGSLYFKNKAVISIMLSFGQALVVASAISYILDLPSMLSFFRSRIIDIFLSKEYLNSLPIEKLKDLRKECTQYLYIKDTEHFEEGLMQLDEKICALLTEIYISYLRIIVICKEIDGMIHKKIHYRYECINPLRGEAIERITGNNLLFVPVGKNESDVRKLKNFIVTSDNGKTKDIADRIKIKYEKISRSSSSYNYSSCFSVDDKDFIELKFGKKLNIEYTEERFIPIYDNIFIYRLVRPCKSFSIEYLYNNDKKSVVGTCFGTLSKVSTGQIDTIHMDCGIKIESYAWLLPGDGVFISSVPKGA